MEALQITQFGFEIFFGTATFVMGLITLFLLTRKNPPQREDLKEKR